MPSPRRSTRPIVICILAACALAAEPRIADSGDILEGAYLQVGKTLSYDGAYRLIPYPGGDIPIERGVCSDVIVRAYRYAGIDLQVLVHEDMLEAFDLYPHLWGLSSPDRNIDHRRVPNLATFFRRHGTLLSVSRRAADYSPGDVVTWRLPSGVPHIGLISDRPSRGALLVVHNIGDGARVEDILFRYEITGHYRYLPQVGGEGRR